MTNEDDDLYEVGDEDFAKFGQPRGTWTVYRNGGAIRHFAKYADAMRFAFPGWQPEREDYDTRSDDLGESPDF